MTNAPRGIRSKDARLRITVQRQRVAPGVTLIELLVVISVIGVLMGIMITSLSSVKGSADLLALLAHQRGADGVLSNYLVDHNGAYPYWGEVGTNYAPFIWDEEVVSEAHWDQPRYWGLYLNTLGYEGWASLGPDAHPGSYESIRDSDCPGCGIGYMSWHMLTNTVYADPVFWHDETAYDKKYFRGLRESDLAHPSAKGILIRRGGAIDGAAFVEIIHFGDGHGAIVKPDELRPGVVRGGCDYSGFPVYCTVDGVEGRDL